ncbi:hypothetical protein QBC37DRAFT_406990 [Rhypophila decipiens]|uniref:Uncharacterized protein n=1 Tax=Rhypophila decipiens TaxID=261697 RepID=A0AAN6XTE9_9PEZI|nr:hypothetical protein QBC37DRAFT_406990 [Rhypophila decipiens]
MVNIDGIPDLEVTVEPEGRKGAPLTEYDDPGLRNQPETTNNGYTRIVTKYIEAVPGQYTLPNYCSHPLLGHWANDATNGALNLAGLPFGEFHGSVPDEQYGYIPGSFQDPQKRPFAIIRLLYRTKAGLVRERIIPSAQLSAGGNTVNPITETGAALNLNPSEEQRKVFEAYSRMSVEERKKTIKILLELEQHADATMTGQRQPQPVATSQSRHQTRIIPIQGSFVPSASALSSAVQRQLNPSAKRARPDDLWPDYPESEGSSRSSRTLDHEPPIAILIEDSG